MVQIVEKDDSGGITIPPEAAGPTGPHTRFAVELEGNAVKLVPVEEQVRTKEQAEQWVKSFRDWIAGLDPAVPHLPDEALRRENMYD